jgi:hypothetical protein
MWNYSSNVVAYLYDQKAFLFSLVNSKNKPIMIEPKSYEGAIYVDSDSLPVFGGQPSSSINKMHDIMLADNCNQNEKSYSNLGTTYNYNQTDRNFFFAGSQYFKVNEIEVYWRP